MTDVDGGSQEMFHCVCTPQFTGVYCETTASRTNGNVSTHIIYTYSTRIEVSLVFTLYDKGFHYCFTKQPTVSYNYTHLANVINLLFGSYHLSYILAPPTDPKPSDNTSGNKYYIDYMNL